MLTRPEQRELAFENDQMISVDYLGRKAKQFDIFQTPGKELILVTDYRNVKKKYPRVN